MVDALNRDSFLGLMTVCVQYTAYKCGLQDVDMRLTFGCVHTNIYVCVGEVNARAWVFGCYLLPGRFLEESL